MVAPGEVFDIPGDAQDVTHELKDGFAVVSWLEPVDKSVPQHKGL